MPKTKISVTVDSSLMKKVDRMASRTTRSEIVEKALERWLREARRQALENEIERYYAGLSSADQAEDEEWAMVSSDTMSETWK
jgi:metal-responsive CopG/Arc/MetJ family transcriptional regulator